MEGGKNMKNVERYPVGFKIKWQNSLKGKGRRKDMKKVNIVIMEEVTKRLGIEIKEYSYLLNEQNDLSVRGGLYIKENFKVLKKCNLHIEADLLDANNNILLSMRDWTSRQIAFSGYGAFCLSYSSIERCFDVEELDTIRLYANWYKE